MPKCLPRHDRPYESDRQFIWVTNRVRILTSWSNVITVYTITNYIGIAEHVVLAMTVQNNDGTGHCEATLMTNMRRDGEKRTDFDKSG